MSRKNCRGIKDELLIDKATLKRLSESIWCPFIEFGMCKNGWSGPEYNHLDREQYGKL